MPILNELSINLQALDHQHRSLIDFATCCVFIQLMIVGSIAVCSCQQNGGCITFQSVREDVYSLLVDM